MTKSNLHRLIIDAAECKTLEEYLAESGGSLPAAYYSNDSADSAVKVMTAIWELRENLTFRSIRKLSGLSQAAFSQQYNIPIRTVENWDSDSRTPPEYLLELLAADVITEKYESEE